VAQRQSQPLALHRLHEAVHGFERKRAQRKLRMRGHDDEARRVDPAQRVDRGRSRQVEVEEYEVGCNLAELDGSLSRGSGVLHALRQLERIEQLAELSPRNVVAFDHEHTQPVRAACSHESAAPKSLRHPAM
jgi:hypothetical protein